MERGPKIADGDYALARILCGEYKGMIWVKANGQGAYIKWYAVNERAGGTEWIEGPTDKTLKSDGQNFYLDGKPCTTEQ